MVMVKKVNHIVQPKRVYVNQIKLKDNISHNYHKNKKEKAQMVMKVRVNQMTTSNHKYRMSNNNNSILIRNTMRIHTLKLNLIVVVMMNQMKMNKMNKCVTKLKWIYNIHQAPVMEVVESLTKEKALLNHKFRAREKENPMLNCFQIIMELINRKVGM